MSKLSEDFQKEVTLQRLSEVCQPFEVRHARAAFYGDAEAAFSLSCGLNNDKRGAVAVAMWRGKVKREAFRAYFASVWDHDHHHVVRAAKSRLTLSCMFRYAAFPLPAELPEVVTVWRGTSGLTFAKAKAGFSWTTDRDTACWFALRFPGDLFPGDHSPLVLTADVPKSEIVLFHDELSESEVVLLRPPAAVEDGNESDWRQGADRCIEARKLRAVK